MNAGPLARALQRGVRGAVAALVLAIAGAAIFPQSEGERLATAAYLAAIFAVVLILAWHCIPERERSRVPRGEASAPAAVSFWIVVAGAVVTSATMAGNLGAEMLIGAVCAFVVMLAALFPRGLFAPLHREVAKDGGLMAVIRYAVLFGIAGWVLAATVPALSGAAASFGFAMLAVAAVLKVLYLRPLRDVLGKATVLMLLALAVAAAVPAYAREAAAFGYAVAVFVLVLVLFRQRFAAGRGESVEA